MKFEQKKLKRLEIVVSLETNVFFAIKLTRCFINPLRSRRKILKSYMEI